MVRMNVCVGCREKREKQSDRVIERLSRSRENSRSLEERLIERERKEEPFCISNCHPGYGVHLQSVTTKKQR